MSGPDEEHASLARFQVLLVPTGVAGSRRGGGSGG